MGSREIKSPESLQETPATSSSHQRKKLSVYFIESDNRRMALGRGYTGGTTPVNVHGKPIADLSKTGGWIAALFIFGNEMAERMAYFGLSVNMVTFMFYVMHKSFADSSNAVNNFLGISQASSVLGGFLADAYLGRYWTIAIFTTIYLAGLTGITLCATMKVFMPNQDNCDRISQLLGSCEPAKSWQMLYLYTVLYITGFGAAGIRPCVSSFGADQFDERSKDYKTHLDRFFNFFYLSVTVGAIVAFTLVVYIQMEHGWGSAFGALAIAMGISNMLFFIGTPLYRHRLPGGSPLTRVAQVLVAAFRKRHAAFSSSELIGLYEVPGKHSAIKGSGKIDHTDDFRCLDKAALELKEDVINPSPWKLCTVTQVEEVKTLVRLVPIPACTIMLNVILTEFLTLSVQQAYTMNTHMGKLKLPVTCHPRGASQLQRVGIGLAVSILSVIWADLSAYWLLIQYCLIGIAEVFCIVGLLEFLYEEAPDAMKSIGSAYAALAGGLGCFAASILNSIIKSVTGNPKKGQPNWLAQNINTGRYKYRSEQKHGNDYEVMENKLYDTPI
ncbi:protein NRT1/ PTR FAMILY 6.1 [Citrus sinensis]|uniref:Protein NRT1/ PTR FAMILY 6.1 n=1 Tax=Citrus sinensis TaxID=2711 RepID=A0ACB8IMW6_CITSI|nr:protein NRT1/ PTR FAMILY 6.1 [Citrus sinensis]